MLFFICFKINASIVVMDADSGRVLYESNMNQKKLIASTTKIMTSIIALENGTLNKEYVVGDEIKKVNGSSIYLKVGDKITLRNLLYGLILRSGNDAAMVIAKNTPNYDDFIMQMNLKAFKLGMYNTSFENPHGLNDDTKNYSTAYDMSLLMKYAIKNKDFLEITSTKKYNNWYNKNELLTDYKYTISGKIGYTKASGQVFVSAAKKNNKTLIIASIDEADKFNLHESLYEKYFKLYSREMILNKYTLSFKDKTSNDHYYILNDFNMLLTENEKKLIKTKIILDGNDRIEVYLGDKLVHTEKLYKLEYTKKVSKIKELLSFFKF